LYRVIGAEAWLFCDIPLIHYFRSLHHGLHPFGAKATFAVKG
jgi:hypothetical protein